MTTYRYASPEVVRKQPYSFSLDMWSVGVILWEMLEEDAQVPAAAWDHRTASESDLESALLVFCNKVDSYRKDAGIPGMTQLACRLLEVAPEARPTAQQVTEDMAFRGNVANALLTCCTHGPPGCRGSHSAHAHPGCFWILM